MTEQEIISMAKQAGMSANLDPQACNALASSVPFKWLESFAKLVAGKERTECALHITDCVAPIGIRGNRVEIGLPARLAYAESVAHRADPTPVDGCECETCHPQTLSDMRFIVCATCGNKRCPHAKDHRNACTNSNELGQKGSAWEHVKP